MTLAGEYLAGMLPGLEDIEDPFEVYQRLLELPEPARAPDGSAIVFARYDHVDEVLMHPSTRSDRGTSPKSPRPTAVSMFSLDPPAHTRIRRLVSRAFTPRRVAEIEPWLDEQIEMLLSRAGERGEFNVVTDLALPLPVAAICQMLGIPDGDRDRFGAWTHVLARDFDDVLRVMSREQQRERRQALRDFRLFITELAARRRAEPTDDLFTDLVLAEEDGDRLSNQELVRNVQLMLAAGHETTASSIASGVLLLAEHTDLRQQVADDVEFAGKFFEEVLRMYAPVQMTLRFAGEDMAIGGHRVAAGTIMFICMAAANIDPRKFEDPLRFDPERPPMRHLAFAGGPHYCLGAALARIEGRLALHSFARRVQDPVVDRAEMRYRDSVVMRQIAHFPLRFSAVAPGIGQAAG